MRLRRGQHVTGRPYNGAEDFNCPWRNGIVAAINGRSVLISWDGAPALDGRPGVGPEMIWHEPPLEWIRVLKTKKGRPQR